MILLAFALSVQSSTPANESHSLSVWQAYFLVVLGIVVSIVLPVLVRLFRTTVGAAADGRWVAVKPYLVIGALSLVAAVVVLAFAGKAIETWEWQNALLAGYAWDSTLQKIAK